MFGLPSQHASKLYTKTIIGWRQNVPKLEVPKSTRPPKGVHDAFAMMRSGGSDHPGKQHVTFSGWLAPSDTRPNDSICANPRESCAARRSGLPLPSKGGLRAPASPTPGRRSVGGAGREHGPGGCEPRTGGGGARARPRGLRALDGGVRRWRPGVSDQYAGRLTLGVRCRHLTLTGSDVPARDLRLPVQQAPGIEPGTRRFKDRVCFHQTAQALRAASHI